MVPIIRCAALAVFLLLIHCQSHGQLFAQNDRPQSDGVAGSDIPAEPTLEEGIRKMQRYNLKLTEINRILRRELDTADVMLVLPGAERIVQVVENRLEKTNDNVNLRYLNALENLLNSMRTQLNRSERTITQRAVVLADSRIHIDSILNDDLMRYARSDGASLPSYTSAHAELQKGLEQTNQSLTAQRLEVAALQSRVANVTNRLVYINDQLQIQKRNLERALAKKEINYIWESQSDANSPRLINVLKDSFKLNQIIFFRYTAGHLGIGTLLLLLWGFLYYRIKRNLRHIEGNKEFAKLILGRADFVTRYPLLSTLLIILAIAPLFYPNRPVIFTSTLMILVVSIAGFLQHSRINSAVFFSWLAFYVLFLLATVSNLFWENAAQERWYLFALGVLGIALAYRIIRLKMINRAKLPNYVLTIAGLYIVVEVVALVANMLGRFSLGKILGVTATMSLMHGLGLIVFVIAVKEFIYLQFEVSRKNHNEYVSYLDFDGIQKRILRFFSFVAIFIWAFFFLDNLSAFDWIVDHVSQFLSEERKLYNATFSFGSIVVFFLVIYLSYVLANNVAYFASIKDKQNKSRDKRLGSRTLLIRLAIIITGFIIAVGLSGVELDKLAIVLGALSVGIGFGLQTVVNNLVSGVILAFERPVQIGDSVQIGTIEGVVQEIGIRASKIKDWNGAEVIIPNGDLLSQALINWTLSDKTRRIELFIGVSHKSDIEQVTQLINLALKLEGIIDHPPRQVLLQSLNERSIEFRVLFWVRDFDTWLILRDQVMRGISKQFQIHGIEIPFPQRDLHIKSATGLIREEVKSRQQINDELSALSSKESQESNTSPTTKSNDPKDNRQ